MRGSLCGKLHGRPLQLLFARPAVIDLIARYFCLLHLHLMPPLGGPYQNIAIMFGVEKLGWFRYPKKI